MNVRLKKIISTTWIAVNIVAAAALMFAGYGAAVSPDVSAVPAIAFMAFPAFVLLSVVLLVLSLFIKRKYALIQATALILTAGPLLTFCPLNFRGERHLSAVERQRTVKILSYNVYSFFQYDPDILVPLYFPESNQTLDYIMSSDADIVCLQEAMTEYNLNYHYPKEADSLLRLYPYQYVGAHNCAIFSRHPFDTIAIRQPDDPTASFIAAQFEIDGTPLTLYNIHLQSIGLSKDDKKLYEDLSEGKTRRDIGKFGNQMMTKLGDAFRHRARQAHLLRSQIDSIAATRPSSADNIILTGDFNDISGCYAMRVISGSTMHDTYTSVGLGPLVTYHAHRFYFPIDHILYSGSITPLSFSRGNLKTSDHYPINATFLLPPPPTGNMSNQSD